MEHKDLKILKTIDNPSQLRLIKQDLLPQLCKELREDIIQELSVNPGHLASSLGVVELTVALHYVFNTPQDRIVWDVGHQAYGHKILTGRRDNFDTNRKLHGIRPFPTPEESEYDSFICGHASNSISAALGMAVASKGAYNVVAVIGDGAMSGGLAFEGLNNVSSTPNDLLIVLNDNDMSIDRSVGGMKEYLLGLSTNKTYNSLRYKASKWLVEQGLLTEGRKKGIIRLTNAFKSAISEQQNVFEGMNIRYFGPYDGHNVKELVRILRQLKDMKGPKLLHLHTQKGHGYAPAENYKPVWHAPGKFDPDTGELIKGNTEGMPPKFQDVFGETLLELAQANPKIVGVTPAMPTGCSMNIPMKVMPDRMFDVGIAEGHALPVVLCFDRAGLVGEDGPTHHGAFDLAALHPIPNLTISSPMDEHELRNLMYTAQLEGKGPFVIRYPRGNGVLTDWRCPFEEIKVGTGRKLRDGSDVAVLTIGPIGNDVAQVIDEIHDHSVAHYDMRFLKPLDEDILHEVGKKFHHIVTVENGVRNGGLGSAVLEWMNDHGYEVEVTRMGLPDYFVEHGTIDQLREIIGLDNESIKKAIIKH